jgi:hypothetical protein
MPAFSGARRNLSTTVPGVTSVLASTPLVARPNIIKENIPSTQDVNPPAPSLPEAKFVFFLVSS